MPGWVWLGYIKDADKLIVTQTNNQDNLLMAGVQQTTAIPIICLNLWEHAYFEQHDGETTGSYLENFWHAIDWGRVSENFEAHNKNGQVGPII